MNWKPRKLLTFILVLNAFDLVFLWLPIIRGLMDGKTYRWELHGLSGQGVSGDYWNLILIFIFGCTILYLGWRGANRPFQWMLLIWNVPFSLFLTYNVSTKPEMYYFQGETLGIQFPLKWPIISFYMLPTLFIIYWVINDLKKQRKKVCLKFNDKNRLFLFIALALIPIQFVLLRFGDPHGFTDQIGVVLTILQWGLLNAGLFPWANKKISHSF